MKFPAEKGDAHLSLQQTTEADAQAPAEARRTVLLSPFSVSIIFFFLTSLRLHASFFWLSLIALSLFQAHFAVPGAADWEPWARECNICAV